MPLATKESHFIFNEILYKQIDGVAMGSPLGPTIANAFLCFYEKKWLEQCPDKFKPVYYRRYVDDIFVLFKSRDHLIKFREYLNKCHPNMKFSFEEEKNGKKRLEKETRLPLLSIANQLLVVSTRTLIVFYLLHTKLA